ncbi:MAG: VWA domain-containing protein [Chloroflexi bacterium]|nr:VWA domain-containing protein [Chloroflexota bacterium]
MWKRFLRNAERGQAIVIVAFAMIGIIAAVGLMTDGGILLIEYGKLKRAIDSAAIASASQFRKNFEGTDLVEAAQDFLSLNQSEASTIIVYRCRRDPNTGDLETSVDGTEHAEDLCTTPRRKLLRVFAERTVSLGFMRVLGINTATINASSVGEAASIDLVLVIDTSASMSYETGGNPDYPDSSLDDPSVCNTSVSNPCEPMRSIKNVARDFVEGDFLFFPYDRVSIVAMTSQVPDGSRNTVTVLPLSYSESDVVNAIEGLNVFQPPECNWGSPASPSSGPCLNYVSGSFVGLECPLYRLGPDLIAGTADDGVKDISSCNSSNIGGALLRAAAEFAVDPIREDSFWAVIALAGGPANATDSYLPSFPYGYCPPSTWNDPVNPFCRDALAYTRHSDGDADYDADDYAHDMADYLADPVDGQGVAVYTIGLGRLIRNAPKGDPDAGEKLLTYIAECAGEPTIYGDAPADPCPPNPDTRVNSNHGFYSFSPDAAGLEAIFLRIASNIFTRLSQ